jgi:hypothetical protein
MGPASTPEIHQPKLATPFARHVVLEADEDVFQRDVSVSDLM